MKKINWSSEFIYSLIYYAIALATAKHSAWAYSTTMEGAQPIIDWSNFGIAAWTGFELVMWFMWGLLAALAVDVGMYLVAKQIRESKNRNLIGLYLTYAMVCIASAYFQVMYAIQHAADFVPVEGVPAWINAIYSLRYLIVPVSLPVMSIGYTLFTKVDEARNTQPLGRVNKEIGMKTYTVDEAATYLKVSPASVRSWAYAGESGKGPQFGARDANNKHFFTQEELDNKKKERGN